MRFSTAVAATALAGAAVAKDINVGVGKDGLSFNPANITAEVGDVVWFKFWPKNHSVAQSTFGSPCEPAPNGFWSGYVPTTDTAKAAELTYMYNVTNASAPIWFYCTQGQHCQSGMVGVINPPSSGNRTLEAFQEAAQEADENVTPSATAGQGGMLMNGTSMSGNSSDTGAASTLQVNGLAISGIFGLVAYLVL